VVRQSDLVGDEDQAGVLEQLELVDRGLFRLSMHL
jgi:hypothetical protein